MQIYLAWSGKRSEVIAAAFRDWLPLVFQQLRPFFSPNDIEKGARWAAELASKLEACEVGLVFITPENQDARWLLFEAGALSKVKTSNVVCIGFEKVEIKQPLSQFQNITFTREHVTQLIRDIYAWQNSDTPSLEVVIANVEIWWTKLEKGVNDALAEQHIEVSKKVATSEEILLELLELARINSKHLSFLTQSSKPNVFANAAPFEVGERVRHRRFGVGVVLRCQAVREDWEVTVAFPGELGIKKLSARFAKLESFDPATMRVPDAPESIDYDPFAEDEA